MTTTPQEHAGVEVQSTEDSQSPSRLDAWIALLGIAAILMAYAIREFLTRTHVAEMVTNLA